MKINKNSFKRFKRTIRYNRSFILIWSASLLIVVGLNISVSKSYNFIGVTESSEVNINSKHAVVIKNINVIPGQRVQKGQLLIELERPGLEKKISEVNHELETLKNKYSLNEKLTNALTSIKSDERDMENPLTLEMKSLKNQIELLNKEQDDLYIFAKFNGHIGSVNFKKGESVSPFAPIVTIHNKTPTFVRGYIHENISNKVDVAAKVFISNLTSDQKVNAEVTNIGTRIIEFPDRFIKTQGNKVWGREVLIKLPDTNEFLLGEKVFLEVRESKIKTITRKIADSFADDEVEFKEISIPKNILSKNNIEPSGIVFVKEINKYYVISDDTAQNKPIVYLMDTEGKIEKKVIRIEGIDKIKDMESITIDENGFIYIASSQSVPSSSTNNKVSKSRRRLLKLKRVGLNLEVVAQVDLLKQIKRAAKKSENVNWVELVKKNKKVRINIEGIAIKNNTMLLGMRNSVGKANEVGILKITNIDRLFETNKLDKDAISLWKIISLPITNIDDLDEGISDLMIKKDQVIIVTASNKSKQRGRVFQLNLERKDSLHQLTMYEDYRPEGITYNENLNEFIVVFDKNTGKKAYMARLSN